MEKVKSNDSRLNELKCLALYLFMIWEDPLATVFIQHFQSVGKYYRGSVDCLKKTIMNEGFSALYKGFIPCWLRMAPWSMTFWLSFEKFRNILGVETW